MCIRDREKLTRGEIINGVMYPDFEFETKIAISPDIEDLESRFKSALIFDMIFRRVAQDSVTRTLAYTVSP